ncbi:Fe2+-dependent dioxygenase [Rhodovulum sp. DZ06]|uniref:Fe2+-dependent dioxygenase n=1 Tax=Rhodovulum sp. DZ06 TaxID=3425126 RepID=UPI003D358C7C
MLIEIPDILTAEELAALRRILSDAPWTDGRDTAGAQSAEVKRNEQLPVGSPAEAEAQAVLSGALARSATFMSAALPRRILPPMFNRYRGGGEFGAHVDNAIRVIPGANETMRADLSCTVFLEDPAAYDGGELVVRDHYGDKTVKGAAGSAVLYPSDSLHYVTPVTRGARLASFFWIQSLVREDARRSMLFDLDGAVQTLSAERGANDPVCLKLTGLYHNLIRNFAEV